MVYWLSVSCVALKGLLKISKIFWPILISFFRSPMMLLVELVALAPLLKAGVDSTDCSLAFLRIDLRGLFDGRFWGFWEGTVVLGF